MLTHAQEDIVQKGNGGNIRGYKRCNFNTQTLCYVLLGGDTLHRQNTSMCGVHNDALYLCYIFKGKMQWLDTE